MTISHLRTLAVLSLVLSYASGENLAIATPLPAGTPPTPITAVPGLGGGGIVIAGLTSPFSSPTPTFTGTLTTTVIRNDAANPFGTTNGYLTFAYQLFNLAGSEDPLERLTINDFRDAALLAPISIDVSYETPALGEVLPLTMDRQLPSGKIVGFNFLLNPGNSLAELIVHTPSLTYRSGVAAAIDGETASPIATFVPLPEPSSALLGVVGIGVVAWWKRRRLCMGDSAVDLNL